MHMDELKAQKIWFCWNYETRKGKRTKVPISAYGTPTGTNAPYAHTWVTYDEAVKAAKEHGDDGVGFKIPEGYFFLDIDEKALSDPFVQALLERFDSYTEYSVSGGGVHIYGKCDISKIPTYIDEKGKLRLDKAFYQKNPNNKTELYCGGITNRFAVFTGNVIRDVPLKECTDALLITLDKNMRKAQKQKYSAKRDGGEKEVFDIVANLLKQKNGEKFRKLYTDGDFSDYGSQSEADCALCAMIAFRTGADPQMIDTVFRSSALMREKWNRDDYQESTIEKGIEACHGTFHRSKMEHPILSVSTSRPGSRM